MENRIPPNDFEAEQAVLSSMLFDKEALGTCYEGLIGDDFYRVNHKYIFEAMTSLYAENIGVDIITLKNKLETAGTFNQIGGMQYLTELVGTFSTSANIKNYIKIVKDKSILRKLIQASNDIQALSYDGKDEIDEIVDKAEKSIFSISQNQGEDSFSHVRQVLLTTVDRIESIYHSKSKITGIPTGFNDFDNRTAGLQASDLILIAARPSMGKTAFALNIAQHASVREKIPTAIFSLEMSKEQLVNRLLCAEAMVDAQRMRTGDLQGEDWAKIVEAVGPLSDANLYIDDTPGISTIELRAKCRRLKMEHGLGLIVIDYLQLMSAGGGGRQDSRQQEISDISRSLKAIAREMDAPVIALSQLSRACEQRADRRPMLSDLRDSGAIEQDADVVAFLYRDEYYNPETEKKNQAEVIIAKQRNGPTGTIDLAWLSQYTKFGNLAHDAISYSE